MKTALKIVTTFGLMFAATAVMAGEPKATLCGDVAQKAAEAMFDLNTGIRPATKSTIELVDMNHGEGATEVWEIKFTEDGFKYMPYRITIDIEEGCIVVGFTIPKAG